VIREWKERVRWSWTTDYGKETGVALMIIFIVNKTNKQKLAVKQ
jgi:hypothetical protein